MEAVAKEDGTLSVTVDPEKIPIRLPDNPSMSLRLPLKYLTSLTPQQMRDLGRHEQWLRKRDEWVAQKRLLGEALETIRFNRSDRRRFGVKTARPPRAKRVFANIWYG